MRKAISNIIDVLLVLAMLDAIILFASMGQIAIEGRTGYWASFWRIQAEFIINLLT